jgi:aldose 1-epimerase
MTELFGTLPDGTEVHRCTLERAGVRVRVLSYGGIVQSVEVPDREGHTANVVLGFDSLAGYLDCPDPYFGALVGRYANRIAGARFTLDGRTYELAANNAPNSLHGGEQGFDKRVWAVEEIEHGVRLSRVSPDGEEGFPGRLEVFTAYTLDADGTLRITYGATTDAPTVVNLTNHSYWNLAGAAAGTGGAAGHELSVAAGRYLPVDGTLIPTGEEASVDGTRFDFRAPRKVGTGYDHNFVLDKGVTATAEPVAELHDPASGRLLTVATTEPGIQVYTGDHLPAPYAPGDAVALETQHYPDSPNRPEFPSVRLDAGRTYHSETAYGFAAR